MEWEIPVPFRKRHPVSSTSLPRTGLGPTVRRPRRKSRVVPPKIVSPTAVWTFFHSTRRSQALSRPRRRPRTAQAAAYRRRSWKVHKPIMSLRQTSTNPATNPCGDEGQHGFKRTFFEWQGQAHQGAVNGDKGERKRIEDFQLQQHQELSMKEGFEKAVAP